MPTVYIGPIWEDGNINTWYMATSKLPGAWLGFGRSQTSLVAYKNTFFAFGGQDASWFFLSNIATARFDAEKGETNNWAIIDGPPQMPQVTVSATWKDRVYLVGGMLQGSVSRRVMSGRFLTTESEEAQQQ